jgi:hypothetical protein
MTLQVSGLEKHGKLFYGPGGGDDMPDTELAGVSGVTFSAEHGIIDLTIASSRKQVSVPTMKSGTLTIITTFQSADERQVFSDAWLDNNWRGITERRMLRLAVLSGETGEGLVGNFFIDGFSRMEDMDAPERRITANITSRHLVSNTDVPPDFQKKRTLLPPEQRIIEVGIHDDTGLLWILFKYFEGSAEYDGCFPFLFFSSSNCAPTIAKLRDLERDVVNHFGTEYSLPDDLDPFMRLGILQRIIDDEYKAATTE